jgi:hypothetical protein
VLTVIIQSIATSELCAYGISPAVKTHALHSTTMAHGWLDLMGDDETETGI